MFGLIKLTILSCVIDAVLVTILVANAIRVMNEVRDGDGEKKSWAAKLDYLKGAWLYALIAGIGTGIVRYFVLKTEIVWLVPILFSVALVLLAFLGFIWYYKHEGEHEIAQSLSLVLAAAIVFFDAVLPAAKCTAALVTNETWRSVIVSIAPMAAVAFIGFLITDSCYYRSREIYAPDADDDLDEAEAKADLAKKFLYGGRVAFIVTLIVMVIIFCVNFNWPARQGSDDKATSATTEISEEDVRKAQDDLTIPKLTAEDLERLTTEKYKDIPETFLDSSMSTHDADRTEKTGFSDALTFGFSKETKEDQFLEVEEEILRNPVYGVTVAKALVDKKIGAKTLGELNPWLKEMTEKEGVFYWLEYRNADKKVIYVTEEYRIYAATLCSLLERMTNQGVQTRQTVENWALNFSIKNNEREGVKADYQYKKEALVLEVRTKDGAVLLRMGFNIHDKRPEFFKDEEPEPTVTDPPKETDPPGGNPPGNDPPNDDPPNDDPPKYNKDPDKAPKENTEPNDNTGPGQSTNNGVGAQHSTEDQPSNSDHFDSYQEYEDAISELEEINDNQREGGDSNRPSEKPATGTNVDNNGSTGNGGADADTATPVQPPAHEAGSGQEISDDPGDAWGGPPD